MSNDYHQPTILFVDTSVSDYESLLIGLSSNVEVHVLNSNQDGILQIASILQGRSDLRSIQILSHGSNGSIAIGETTLNNSNLSSYSVALQRIGSSLSATGDILLYGCNVAQDESGLGFITQLANLTGADVAASNNLTGFGGDWDLEVSKGIIESESAISQVAQIQYTDTLALVINTNLGSINGQRNLLDSAPVANPDNLITLQDTPITFDAGQLLNNDTDFDSPNLYANHNVYSYDGHYYCLSNASGWQNAETEAQSFGGDLVTINDENEQNWLTQTFGVSANSSTLWIGYTDQDVENDFKWISGDSSTYTNWTSGEPNSYWGLWPAENYAQMYSGGTWNDLYSDLDSGGYGIIELSSPPSIAISSVTNATGGTAVLNTDGSVTFTPTADFSGIATFDYQATDGTTLSNLATVSVNVIIPPNSLTISTNEDTVVPISLSSSVPTDSFSVTNFPVNGSLFYDDTLQSPIYDSSQPITATSDAATIYFKPNANWSGTTSFSYASTNFLIATATSEITVNPVADTPIFQQLIYTDSFTLNTPSETVGADLNNQVVEFSSIGGKNWTSADVYAGGYNTIAKTAGNGYITPNTNHSSSIASLPYTLGSGIYSLRANLYPEFNPDVGYLGLGFFCRSSGAFVWQAGTTNLTLTFNGSGDWVLDGPVDSVDYNLAPILSGNVIATTWSLSNPPEVVLTWDTINNTVSGSIGGVTLFTDYTLPNTINASQVTCIGIPRDGALGSNSIIDNFSFSQGSSPNTVSGYENYSIPLSIFSSLVDTDGSENLTIVISGIPTGTTLSAGTNNDDGTWALLTTAELDGLTLTSTHSGDFDLTVTATASETSNSSIATTSQTLSFSIISNTYNNPPVAESQSLSGQEDTALAITLTGTDVDGTIASFQLNSLPANGTLYLGSIPGSSGALKVNTTNATLSSSQISALTPTQISALTPTQISALTTITLIPADGKLYFKPDANWNGDTTFSFVATDDQDALSVAATVTLTISADIYSGTTGNDTIVGSIGSDTLSGGLGDDIYTINDAANVVIENLGEGFDTVHSTVSYTLSENVEDLYLDGNVAINGTGNIAGNWIHGNEAANTLDDGGSAPSMPTIGDIAADTLSGGKGNDVYIVHSVSTQVIGETNVGGVDTVQSYVNFTLPKNVENLTFTGILNASGKGNNLANVMIGNDGNNTLDGGAGADALIGNGGDDLYIIDRTTDVVTESSGQGTDTVQSIVTYMLPENVENLNLMGLATISGTGNTDANIIMGNDAANALNGGAGNDGLIGKNGNDILIGGAGSDTLIGGVGVDTLTGGTDADRFIFESLTDMGTATRRDVITDFNHSEGDKIDLSGLITGTFISKGTSAFDAINQIHWSFYGSIGTYYAVVQGNVSGDFAPEFEIKLTGVTALTDTDFNFDLLQQAGTAMLAQANQSGQSVMTLLR